MNNNKRIKPQIGDMVELRQEYITKGLGCRLRDTVLTGLIIKTARATVWVKWVHCNEGGHLWRYVKKYATVPINYIERNAPVYKTDERVIQHYSIIA